jgi:hypothetical protein
MIIQDCLDDLLIRGLDDWIQASEVASVTRIIGGKNSDETVRDLSIQLIRTLLESGFVEVGMVEKQKGFIPWKVSVDDAMQRIERDWFSRPTGPGLGEVCWLNLTEKGESQAKRLWSREVTRK